jgi:signal transduction histidine kinase
MFATYAEDGSMIRAFGILRDVTDAKRVEEDAARQREELLRADRMISLGILVSGIAHEINNPNHAIGLNAPLVRDAWREAAALLDELAAARANLRIGRMSWQEARGEVAEMIEDIEQASDRIRHIVTELRGFAIDQGPGERGEVLVNDVVTASMRLLGNHIARATRHFELTLGDATQPVSGNARRLEQVVVNLVINACQALEHDGQAIRLTTGSDGQRVFIRVQDEGRGIAPEHLSRIRTPFFTTKRGEGGTGLGVPVSDRIAREHGGELTFESEPGRGTTATLWLPRAEQ